MGLFQLVYKSQAAENISYSDILEILKYARAANSLMEITGVLIFKEGSFLQILEGKESKVLNLMKRIYEDPRHTQCKILAQSKSAKRFFPEFSMAYFDGDLCGNGVLEVDSILDLGRQGSKAHDLILQGFKVFKESRPQLING